MRSSFVTRGRRGAAGALVVCMLHASRAAYAAPTEAAATAEVLFAEGKRLMTQRSYDQACPKLAESQRLDPALGTLLALGVCHEAAGHTATAWAIFKDVDAQATSPAHADRRRIAQARAAALETRLPRLTIEVPPDVASTPELRIRRDDIDVTPPAFGTPLPVDPGQHTITVSAREKKTLVVHQTIANGEHKTVAIARLEDEPAAVAGPRPPPPLAATTGVPGSAERPSRVAPFGLLGLGAIAIGAGSVFGVRAITLSGDAKDLCSASDCADRDRAVETRGDALTAANVANVAVGVGIIAIATGVILLLATPSRSSPVNEARR